MTVVNEFLNQKVAIPRNDKEAMNSTKFPGWNEAWKSELQKIVDAGGAKLVPKEEAKRVIGYTGIFTIKSDGKLKARFCPLGNQRQTIGDTHAEVAAKSDLKLLLTLAGYYDWEIIGKDVKGAFLNTPKTSGPPIHVRVPPDWPNPDKLDLSRYHLEIMKWIYGFGESMHEWTSLFFAIFTKKLKMTKFTKDWAMFRKNTETESKDHNGLPKSLLGIAGTHVDDITWAGEKSFVNEMISKMSNEVELQAVPWVEGEMQMVGWTIRRDRKERKVFISQKSYIEKIAANHAGIPTRIYHTPMDPLFCFNYNTKEPILGVEEQEEYHSLVAELLHATQTRLDIVTHVSILSSYINRAQKRHMEQAMRVLAYLVATKDFEQMLGPDKNGKLELKGYGDVSYAGEEYRKSRVGGTIFYGCSVLDTISKRHKETTPLSTCEGEVVAQSEVAKRLLYFQELIEEIKAPQTKPANLYCDNQAAIALSTHNKILQKSRHIEIRYLAWREWLEQEKLKMNWIPTKEMVADCFTKILSRADFERFRLELGIGRFKKQGVLDSGEIGFLGSAENNG
jgi:hypothetical protein